MGENLKGKITAFNTYHTDAYMIAVKNGFEGTEAEWLASLKGDKGDKGDTGAKGEKGDPGKDGVDGKPGADGYTPVKGVDYCTEADMAEVEAIVDAKLANIINAEEVAY